MVEYSKVNVKLSDSQLNKLKTTVKDQTGVTLQMNIKTFNGNNLPHEYYWQQDKKRSSEMHLKTVFQLICSCLKLKYLK